MALTPQEDSQTWTPGAESYLSVSDADAYWADHGSPADWTGATTAQKEAALRYASTWLDREFSWIGSRTTNDTNRLEWPRTAANVDGRKWEGVPTPLQHATAEMALHHIQESIAARRERADRAASLSVEGVDIVYSGSSGTSYPFVVALLEPIGSLSSDSIRLLRAG